MRSLPLVAILALAAVLPARADDAPAWTHEVRDDWRLARVDATHLVLRHRQSHTVRVVAMSTGKTVKEYELEFKPIGFAEGVVVGSDGHSTLGVFDVLTGERTREVTNARSPLVVGSSLYAYQGGALKRFPLDSDRSGATAPKFPIGQINNRSQCAYVQGRAIWVRAEGKQLACFDLSTGRIAWKKTVGAARWTKKVLVKTSKRTYHRKVPTPYFDRVEKYVVGPDAVGVVCSRPLYNPWHPDRKAEKKIARYLWLLDVARGKDKRIPLERDPSDADGDPAIGWGHGADGTVLVLVRKHRSDPTVRWEAYTLKGKLVVKTGFLDADLFTPGARGARHVLLGAGAADSRKTYAIKTGKQRAPKKLWTVPYRHAATFGDRYLGWRKTDEAIELATFDTRGAVGEVTKLLLADAQIRALAGRAVVYYRDKPRLLVLDARGPKIEIVRSLALPSTVDREPLEVDGNLLIHLQGKGWAKVALPPADEITK